MANKFAWASIGENGKATGGKPGDQTGKEVKIGDYYNFGQDKCIRFKNVTYARKAGKIAAALAKNAAVGYNQNGRAELYNLAKKCGWNFDKLIEALKKKKVNCDCSSFCSTVINLTFEKQLVACCTTATLADSCGRTHRFEILPIKEAEKKFRKGDMPIKAHKHVIINV